MTFSIVGRATDGPEPVWGVAVASKFLAVGSVVPAAVAGVGALATQADANVAWKGIGLSLLDEGATASVALQRMIEEDDKREHRQLGIVDAEGGAASHTGHDCFEWAGGVAEQRDGEGVAIQGNILAGPEVVAEMERAWLASSGQRFTARLIGALLAGDAAGGDSRGRQAAALYAVQAGSGYDACGVLADLRVDDHPEAPQELARLLEVHDLVFGGPEDVRPLTGPLAAEVSERLGALGFPQPDVEEALAAWAGQENSEMRLSPGGIDALVLTALRRRTG